MKRVGAMSSLRFAQRIILTGVIIGLAGALSAALPERKTFQFGAFTIEATAGDEAYVEALALQLVDYKLPAAPALAPAKLSLNDLRGKRGYFLAKVASQIGLDQPIEKMESFYDMFLRMHGSVQMLAPKELPKRFSLWRRTELVARINAGEQVAGFSKDVTGGLVFAVNFDFDISASGPAGQSPADRLKEWWSKQSCPIPISAEAGRTPAEEVSAGLETMMHRMFTEVRERIPESERLMVFNILHETAEAGVVWHYLTSSDRRWFCDGVANYVAWKVIEAEIGATDALAYYDLPSELLKYQGEAARVDLTAWPAVEDLEKLKYPAGLDAANYAFATKVIADICAKHGDEFLPKLFKEIGKTPREKATMDTVYRAYKRLTREDLHSYLPKPTAKR